MIEVEYRTLAADQQRVLVHGNSALARGVAEEFLDRGIPTAIADSSSTASEVTLPSGKQVPNLHGSARLLEAAEALVGPLTCFVNLYVPSSAQPEAGSYAEELRLRNLEAAEYMASRGIFGCIINHCVLPAMYAGTAWEDHLSILRGAVTGITRSTARRYGKQGIRCIGVQTGLLDLGETPDWIHPEVRAMDVPVKRWGSARDVAKLVSFLNLQGTYITGQTIILDGGLTAGISGT